MPKRAVANSEPVAHGPMDMCLKKMKDHAAAGGVYTPIKIEPEVMVNAPRAPAPTRPPKKQPSASSKKAAKPDANVDEALATEPTRLETEPSRDDHDLEHLDAASWVANFVKNQKKDYNAFYYRLGKQGPHKVEEWKEIQKRGTAAEAEAFVHTIKSANLKRTKEFTLNLERTNFLRTWKTYKEALEKYDEEVLLDMIRAKTLETKRDPSIPESLNVPWPKYLQLRLLEESEAKRQDRGRTMAEESQLDDDEYECKIVEHKAWNPSAAQTAPHGASSHQQHQLQEPNKQQHLLPESVLVALKSVRIAHATCDKFVRDLGGVVESSKANPNSAGCKIEGDLEGMVAELGKFDEDILKFEKLCLTNAAKVSSKDIESAAATAKRIDDQIKSGRKKVAALKTLWKL